MKTCILERRLHSCPYLGTGQECLSKDFCSMQEQEKSKKLIYVSLDGTKSIITGRNDRKKVNITSDVSRPYMIKN